MEDNIDDLIIDFLYGKMDPTTRLGFEQRLAAEPELAARVALERDIAAALNAAAPENQLRANLSQIAAKYPSVESLSPASVGHKGRKTHIWWWLGVMLLILGTWVYWQRAQEHKAPAQSGHELPASPVEEATQNAQEAEKTSPKKQAQPIAAAFKPIPTLESYIGSQRRSGDFQIHLDEPKSGASFHLAANQLQFRLSGKMEGQVPAGTGFKLMIFSNKEKDFEALRAVVSQVLEINPDGKFLVTKQWTASPGLYYLVIEDQQSGEWLLVDKFLVKT